MLINFFNFLRSIDTKCEEVCCGDHKTVSRSIDNSVAFLQLKRRRKCGVGKMNGRNSLQVHLINYN